MGDGNKKERKLTRRRQMLDEEVHPRFSTLADDQGDENGQISNHYHREQDPKYRELLCLKGKTNWM